MPILGDARRCSIYVCARRGEQVRDADDLGRLLGDNFTVEQHTVVPRIDPPPGTPHIADVVLRARRC
jgi:hypothetical protein